jgi:predicted metal-dependent phosphoesterase TrpH
MKMFKADLHIHTCLSPCADLDMSPTAIAREAKSKGIEIAGICDHNSAENVPGVRLAAEKAGVNVIGGMEVTSIEEVHILALFDSEDALMTMQQEVYDHLPGVNDEKRFGEQIVADENDELLSFNKKLLIGATELSLERIVEIIHDLGGLAIASHIDREGFGIIGQLGFIPEGLPLDAVEVSPAGNPGDYKDLQLPVITASDAHRPADIGKSFTGFWLEEVTLHEIRSALLKLNGRRVVPGGI